MTEDGNKGIAKEFQLEGVPDELRLFQVATSGKEAMDFEGTANIFRSQDDTFLQLEAGPIQAVEEDWRVLHLDFDHAEERHRSIDSSLSASCKDEFI